MKIKMLLVLVILSAISATSAFAAAMNFECDVAGAKLQVYDYRNRVWGSPVSLPHTIVEPRYTLVIIKVTAPGHEDFEQNFEAAANPQRHVINLVPDTYNPDGVPLFGWAGQIVSKRGLSIMANQYKVVMRNMTTHKKTNAAQVSQDIVYNSTGGHFSCCLANFSTIRNQYGSAALPGDRVYVGAFNSNLTICYGYKVITLTEEDVSNAGVYMNIFVR